MCALIMVGWLGVRRRHEGCVPLPLHAYIAYQDRAFGDGGHKPLVTVFFHGDKPSTGAARSVF